MPRRTVIFVSLNVQLMVPRRFLSVRFQLHAPQPVLAEGLLHPRLHRQAREIPLDVAVHRRVPLQEGRQVDFQRPCGGLLQKVREKQQLSSIQNLSFFYLDHRAL